MLLFSSGIIHTVDASLPNPGAVLAGDGGRSAAVGARCAGTSGRASCRPGWAYAVLSSDPLTTPPDDLLGLVVEQTDMAGDLAYERP
jgi:hypothetical protein